MTDEQIVARVAGGDHELFGLLWQRHYGWSLAFARRLAGAEGEDAHQNAWAGVFQAIVSGRGPRDAFAAYLNRAVRNAAVDSRRRATPIPIGGGEDLERLLTPQRPGDELPVADRVVEAFKTLPDRQRRALWDTLVEGYNPADVAPELGMTPNAFAGLTYRAREALRRAWQEVNADRTPAGERATVHVLFPAERRAERTSEAVPACA